MNKSPQDKEDFIPQVFESKKPIKNIFLCIKPTKPENSLKVIVEDFTHENE